MIYTPETCPVQAGMVVHDFNANIDYVVQARNLGPGTEDSELIMFNNTWYTGRQLHDLDCFEYYKNTEDWDSERI